ncbi:MAG TPA: hypothetical protein DCP31_13570 [Cyanobacteria bacterium UBA8543]|nr:hypothetical protein [Cyanobacteria bacterium UBA8543]
MEKIKLKKSKNKESKPRLRVKLNVSKFLLLDLGESYFIYGFILFILSFVVSGYRIYEKNQDIQIPLVHLLNNPSLYPNDPFAATLLHYPSLLWQGVAIVARVIPLEPLLFSLFLLERLLVIYTAGNLARTLAGNSKLAIMGAIAIFSLAISPLLGAGTIVENYFEQTGFAIPFFLLAIASFYKSRPINCAIWTAIGFNFNSMYGTYALTYFTAVFLLDSTYRNVWKKWLVAFGLFLVLVSPTIFLTISAFGRNAPDNHLWLLASQVRFSYHLYPLTWKWYEFAKFVVVIIALGTLLYQNRQKMEKLFKHGAIWTGVSLLWLLYAFLAAYVFKSPSMLVMHPARGTDLWCCFAAIVVMSICAINFEASTGRQRRIIWAIAFICSILFWHSPLAPYPIIVVSLIVLISRPLRSYILSKNSISRLTLLITVCVFLVGIVNFYTRLTATKSVTAALFHRPPAAIEEIARWANTNTSLDKVFLVPPATLRWKYFRALAKRPVFITWKDASAILWERSFVQDWAERMQAFGLDITQDKPNQKKVYNKLKSLYRQLGDEDIKRLKSRYKIDYWVVPIEQPSTLAIAFQNPSFKVLKLN